MGVGVCLDMGFSGEGQEVRPTRRKECGGDEFEGIRYYIFVQRPTQTQHNMPSTN